MKHARHTALFILLMVSTIFACAPGKDKKLPKGNTNGITDTEIIIGSSLALGGHAAYLGTQTIHGALSYINYVNEKGGIHGRKISMITYDDGYDPPRCVYYTQKLIAEDKVFCLFCYVGTPTTVKIIPLVQEARIPLLGMFTGANALRNPFNRYLINVRASYYQETDAVVTYMVEDLGIQKIAVFYQYDAYGFDGLKGTELALKKHNLTPIATGTYIRGTLDIGEGRKKIVASGAEAVVMIGTYDPCAKFIRLCREQSFNPLFCNVSFVGAEELARKLDNAGEGVIVTQVVPPPEPIKGNKLLWGAKEYAKRLKFYYPDDEPNFVGLEGYINAMVLVEGLRRAGVGLNREKFIDAIETITDYDLGIANRLSFSPSDHQGLERVYFTKIHENRFVLLND